MPPTLVTAALIIRDQRILVTRRPQGGRHAGWWEFPGGKLHPDEAPQDGLQREIMEELNLPVAVGRIFEVIHHRYPTGAVLLLFYFCTPLADKIENIEVAEHRWVTAAELTDLRLLPADAPLAERLQSEASEIFQKAPND